MTNEELFTDLKHFIEATVSQQLAHVATKEDVKREVAQLEGRVNERFDKLDAKLDEIQEGIADTLTKSVEAVDTTKQVQDLEHRVHRLEQRAA